MKFTYFCLFLLLFSTPISSQVNLKIGLIACYPFNGYAKDEPSNNNDGIGNSATLTADHLGKVNR